MPAPFDPFARPPTMAAIAEHLGLARSTVSMALRNHPEIAIATRERVMRAAEELGYRPNSLVSLLMAQVREPGATRTDTVLAVVSEALVGWHWRRFPVFERMWAGIESQARRRGYRVEEFSMGPIALSPARLTQILQARGVPGVILAPQYHAGPSHFSGWEHFAVSTINWSVSAPDLPRASIDFFRNLGRAWVALEARGYRRIGFIDNPGLSGRQEHFYRSAFLGRQGLMASERRVAPLVVAGDRVTRDILAAWLKRERPDAVLVNDASSLVPLLREVAEVPQALGVAGLEVGCAPAGTAGIDERMAEAGVACVDLLIGQLQRNERGLPEAPRTLLVPGVWRDGMTVRPLAG